MATHEVIIHENTSATKLSAPYLGNYVTKDSVNSAGFAPNVANKCGLQSIQVRTILDGCFDAACELEREALTRLHTDIGVICGVITGSFPTADAAFDATKNSLNLALRLEDTLRNAMVDITPAIVTDETVTKLRVDNVMDDESPRPYEVIYGTRTFGVYGLNMDMTAADSSCYLENSLGVIFPTIIDEKISAQHFKAHTQTLLEPGDYKCVVQSRAGDSSGPLQTAFRKVKYLKIARPPTLTKAYPSFDSTLLDNLVNNGNNVIEGTRLLNAKIYVDSVSEANELALVETATDTKLVFEGCGKTAGSSFTLIVKNAEGQVERTVTAVNPPAQPTLTKVYAESNPALENHIQCFEEINDLIGTDLTSVTAIKYTWMSGGEEPVPMEENGEITSKTATLLKFKMPEVQFGTSGNLVVTWSGGEVTLSGVTADMPE